jgi:hypothetical protein
MRHQEVVVYGSVRDVFAAKGKELSTGLRREPLRAGLLTIVALAWSVWFIMPAFMSVGIAVFPLIVTDTIYCAVRRRNKNNR